MLTQPPSRPASRWLRAALLAGLVALTPALVHAQGKAGPAPTDATSGTGADGPAGQAPAAPQAPTAFPAAPALRVAAWLQGAQASLSADPQRVYVLELWATWCGPCIDAMPHLAELQREHPDEVTVIALSDEPAAVVQRFLDARGALGFAVAVDKDELTTRDYMRVFQVDGIPTTFLIQDNAVVWHGHPDHLDPVLTRLLAGQWTPETRQGLRDNEALAEAFIDGIMTGASSPADRLAQGQVLLERARALEQAPLLNGVAWFLLTEVPPGDRPGDLALQMADAARALTRDRDHDVLDTLALAQFEAGDVEAAIITERRALTLCRAAAPPSGCAFFQGTLERFESARDAP